MCERKVSPACPCGDCKVDCSIIGTRQGPRKASVLIFSKPSIFLEPCLGCPLPPRRSSHSGDSLQCLLGHWVDACLPTEGSLPVLYSTLGSMPIHEILHLWLQLIRCVCLGWKIIVCHPSSFACIIYDSNWQHSLKVRSKMPLQLPVSMPLRFVPFVPCREFSLLVFEVTCFGCTTNVAATTDSRKAQRRACGIDQAKVGNWQSALYYPWTSQAVASTKRCAYV